MHLNKFVQGQQIPGFISIDCGAQNDYLDSYLNLYYETDAKYVDTGENRQVSTDNIYVNNDERSKNLRIFPNGTRNCYTLGLDQGKGNKYLIRASFFYGNYGSRNVTPVFDVHIDTNVLFTVHRSDYFCEEVIYSPSRDYVQLCLINTRNGVPFISALELRLLDRDIYPVDLGALVMSDRYALGMQSWPIRHPDDAFDRIWYHYFPVGTKNISNNTILEIDPTSNPYKVPMWVLETAQVLSDPSFWVFSSNITDSWYIYLYFTEIQALQTNQSREFSVYVDNEVVATESLQFSTMTTFQSQMITGQTNVSFGLSPTAQSTLLPTLNAFEIYQVLDLPNPMTAQGDFDAMVNVRMAYRLVQTEDSWQGDPCIPAIYTWSGLNCSNDNNHRIISLNLSSSGLTGLIAPAFANLTMMESLDLSNNQLTGPVPDYFAQMPSLKILNLSVNNLNGTVPRDLMKKKQDGTLLLGLDGNQNLCNSTSCSSKGWSRTKRGIIVPVIASTLSVVVVILLAVIAIIWRNGRKGNDGSMTRISRNRVFSYSEIECITDNFKNIIGEGGFGKVYLGKLEEGTKVAVKVLSHSSSQGPKEFETEAKLLMVVHHRNLVNLIGYCDEPGNMALVYEYMSQGNLQFHLSKNLSQVISWSQRLQIAVDAAHGLEYLHSGCRPPIIHRDFKTTNILLDENLQAKIADFGLSRAFTTDFDSHVSTTPAGTPGYLDPEFHSSGNLNQKSDVYSFGIVLFELITGLPAVIKGKENVTHILHRVTPLIRRGNIESVMDPKLNGEYNIASAWKAVEIAMSCVPAIAVQRPDMSHVLLELKECMTLELVSPQNRQNGISKRSYSFETSSLDFEMSPTAR
ncbi:hypothetical protein MLD38_007165 [Melastoma candidum]|uniref:Uncharacterized protein n=1 Tax=Melastoma candidum TaxID=119954 RepID=A0ACB9RUH0_9MYRT|nr:hypothetical protein MLD38_007165 [Melastoma candidum]